MSINNYGRQGGKLVVINELPEIGSYSEKSATPLLDKSSLYEIEMTQASIMKSQVVPTDEEYAHLQTKHTFLIGDMAQAEKTVVSTQNWKERIRKQYNTQKFLKFRAPYQINRKIQIISQFKKAYMQHMPIIDPQSSFLTFWKIPIMIITILVFVEVPLVIFFGDDFYFTFHKPIYVIFRSFVIMMFALDIFIEFHVAFYNHGALVKNRHRVAYNYLKGTFFFDIVPLIQVLITTFSYYMANIYVFHLIFLLKMYPVYEIDQRFQDKLQVYPKWKSAYMIMRMVIEIIYLTHFFGCIFFGTGMYMLKNYVNPDEGLYTNSWLTFGEGNFGIIQDYGWTKRYILSTYWAFATLTTVAYGDITPMNEFEIVVSEVAMVAAVFLVAFNVNNIQQTFVDYFDETRKYQKEIIAITKFMRSKDVSEDTEKEIRNFLEHYFKEKRNRDHYLEEQVFLKLAPQLKSRLMYEAYQKFLNSVPWMGANFSEDFIKELSQSVIEIDYSKKENIFLDSGQENTDDNSLYFLQIGQVELFIDVPETFRQEVIICHLKPGAHFGDFAFITGMERKASARSKKYSQVVRLTRTDFIEKLQQFPMDHQRFCYLRDEIIFNQAYNELGIECFTCQATDHMSIDCPLTHLSIGKEIIKRARKMVMDKKFIKMNANPEQLRNSKFEREKQFKDRTLFKMKIKQEMSDSYQEIIDEKIKFEAFYSDNQVIIESFQIEKIQNFIHYYPDFNFDYLVNNQKKDRRLIFAKEAKMRNVSGIFRRSEILG